MSFRVWSFNPAGRSPSHDFQNQVERPEAPPVLASARLLPSFLLELHSYTQPFDFLGPDACRGGSVEVDFRDASAGGVVWSRHEITRIDPGGDAQPPNSTTRPAQGNVKGSLESRDRRSCSGGWVQSCERRPERRQHLNLSPASGLPDDCQDWVSSPSVLILLPDSR